MENILWQCAESSADCTWAISSVVLILVALVFRSSTTAWVATVMPRRRSIGFMPAATDLAPSARMDLVKTVAVVVPALVLLLFNIQTEGLAVLDRYVAVDYNALLFNYLKRCH